jgi:hypothetical protein
MLWHPSCSQNNNNHNHNNNSKNRNFNKYIYTFLFFRLYHRYLIKKTDHCEVRPCLAVNVISVSSHCKILAVKVGTSVHQGHLPCQPTCLVSTPALFVPNISALVLLKLTFSKLLRYLWILPMNPYRMRRLSTIDLLVLTSLD